MRLIFLIIFLILLICYIEIIYIPNKDTIDHFLKTTKNVPIVYSKINGISSINWINLDRSPDRRKNMESLLNNVNVPKNRISAIDGKKEDLSKYKTAYMSNGEVACTLSHIKAINSLKDSSGEYFMICEDDITFDNLKYFNESLDDIIKSSPKFDILLINHINYLKNNYDTYEKWNKNIYSTACYIISKDGINKFINEVAKYSNGNFEIYKDLKVADTFIYEHLNSIKYKYNFIDTEYQDSTINTNFTNMFNYKRNYYYQLDNIMKK
jgi:GR25 family glycosyltransferase involved in LPS biosynthesis